MSEEIDTAQIEAGKHEKAMTKFLNDRDWISNDSMAAVMALECARQLDSNWRTQAYAELLRTIRYINSLNPSNEKETDEDELFSPNR